MPHTSQSAVPKPWRFRRQTRRQEHGQQEQKCHVYQQISWGYTSHTREIREFHADFYLQRCGPIIYWKYLKLSYYENDVEIWRTMPKWSNHGSYQSTSYKYHHISSNQGFDHLGCTFNAIKPSPSHQRNGKSPPKKWRLLAGKIIYKWAIYICGLYKASPNGQFLALIDIGLHHVTPN